MTASSSILSRKPKRGGLASRWSLATSSSSKPPTSPISAPNSIRVQRRRLRFVIPQVRSLSRGSFFLWGLFRHFKYGLLYDMSNTGISARLLSTLEIQTKKKRLVRVVCSSILHACAHGAFEFLFLLNKYREYIKLFSLLNLNAFYQLFGHLQRDLRMSQKFFTTHWCPLLRSKFSISLILF